ncbi:MAG: 16S rRNA processing protein RimM [Robiginitomaculum sp.]|nr:16S rRNA processing protein RimM [Robiginitomaculum sp.]
MLEPSHTVFIAAIAGAFGAKGEIKIKSFTQDPAACLEYAPFVDEAGKEILKISKPRVIKGGFAVRSPGIQYRDQAEALRGTKLYCLRSQLRKPEEDEFYHSDLVGLQVQSAEGQILGQITAIHNFGASDLLEITGTPDVAEDWTLPFTLAHVPTVDIAAKTVIIADWQRFLPEAKAQKKPRDHDA